MLTALGFDCIFASLVLFVFHNWAHPIDRPVLGGFFSAFNFYLVCYTIYKLKLALLLLRYNADIELKRF